MKTLNIPRGSYVLKMYEITPEITDLILSNLEYDKNFSTFLKKMTGCPNWVRLNISGGQLEDYGHMEDSYFKYSNYTFCLNGTPIHFKEILKYLKEPPKCLRRL